MGQLSFQLDNPSAAYFAGQVVTGRLYATFDSQKIIKVSLYSWGAYTRTRLKLKCFGKGHVYWCQKSRNNRRARTYSNDEEYFCNKIYFLGTPDGQDVTVNGGRYMYPFAFQLPRGIPSSFEETYGWIRYSLEATIKKGMFKFNVTTELLFTVNGIVDLNMQRTVSQPFETKEEKNLCCLCCQSGPVGFVLKVPKIGFVPGEHLRFQAEIFNNNSQAITEVDIRIKQEVEFHSSGGKIKRTYSKVLELRGPEIPAYGEKTWQSGDRDAKITPLPPTNLGGGSVIGLHYIIELILKIPDAIDLTGGIPIIIGTIPLRNEFANFNATAIQPSIHGQANIPTSVDSNSTPSAPPQIYSHYPNMPPPGYAIAIHMDKPNTTDDDEEGCNDTTNFLPKYATYGWTARVS